MEDGYYDLDKWKTFVLRVLLEKNGSSLTDYVWKRLKHEFSLGGNEEKEHYLYTESVLKCLEVEHGLVSLKSATYWVSWDFACKRQKFILLYIFLA